MTFHEVVARDTSFNKTWLIEEEKVLSLVSNSIEKTSVNNKEE